MPRKIKCKNLVFDNVGISKDCNAQYHLNHFKYNMCMYCQEYFQVILVIISYHFNLLVISDQISKVSPFLKLGCK